MKLASVVLLSLTVFGCAGWNPFGTDPSVGPVVQPAGGEQWRLGENHKIKWESHDTLVEVRVVALTGHNVNQPALIAPGNLRGYIGWKVGTLIGTDSIALEPGDYYIRVCSVDSINSKTYYSRAGDLCADSNPFTIDKPLK